MDNVNGIRVKTGLLLPANKAQVGGSNDSPTRSCGKLSLKVAPLGLQGAVLQLACPRVIVLSQVCSDALRQR